MLENYKTIEIKVFRQRNIRIMLEAITNGKNRMEK